MSQEDAHAVSSEAAILRLIVNSARDSAVLAMDRDGRVILWNSGAQALFGWMEAETLGQEASFIFTPEDRAAGVPERELATARAQGQAIDERWHLRRDGSLFWASGMMMAMRDGAPDGSQGRLLGFVKVVRDLTERRLMEERLRESEERYRRSERRHRLALEGARLGTFFWQVATGQMEWSATMREFFFLSPEAEVTLATFWEGLHPEDRDAVFAELTAAQAQGTLFEREFRVVPPGQRWAGARVVSLGARQRPGLLRRTDGRAGPL